MDNATIELAKSLITCPSVTPDDAGCLTLIAERLRAFGFATEIMPFGDVTNLWATHGAGDPVFTFAGHTDVVPTGPPEEWHSDPFEPVIKDGMLYGRGAADMKSSLAAMVTALERFLGNSPIHRGTLSLLLTSDEEGVAIDGTAKVITELQRRNQNITWCLVGEPSSISTLGDQIRNGRRGSLNGVLRVKGLQGHVAYPEQAVNPIHQLAPALHTLCTETWDEGNEFYPPTSFQISNLHAGTGAENVIPGTAELLFNFRFSTENTVEKLRERVEQLLNQHSLDFSITWRTSGLPFLTPGGELLHAVKSAIEETLGVSPDPSTGGGTSDGRFIAPIGAEVIEFGPLNKTIHQVNECVPVADLERLSLTYESIVRKLMA